MKTITFKTLSILLAAVLLVAALPVTAFANNVYAFIDPGHTTHLFEEYVWTECEFFSVDWHEIATHTTKQCSVCGILSDDEVVRYHMEKHDDVIEDSDYIYEYDSNEYHNRIECTVITYRCCGNIMLTIPDYSTAVLEEHEIHPSVDQECEIQGPCIHCDETIYW
ncbi:MAG: hypothetical protein IJB43_09820 [Clostridia bacterium]|nr:hypothetical protein [Clostridia bacterium]